MNFGSKATRAIWVSLIAWIVVDGGIAYGLASLSEPPFGETVTSRAVFFFVIMQAAALFVWFKRTILMWGRFFLFGRRTGRRAMVDYLKSHGFPEPDLYYSSASDYLESVSNNDELPVQTRLLAAREVGSMNAPLALGQAQLSLQIMLILEDAVQAYKRLFPPRSADRAA